MTVFVERDSQKAIVIGRGGSRLREVGTTARAGIESLLGQRVHLDLHVKVARTGSATPRRCSGWASKARCDPAGLGRCPVLAPPSVLGDVDRAVAIDAHVDDLVVPWLGTSTQPPDWAGGESRAPSASTAWTR